MDIGELFRDELYVTLAGAKHYFGNEPFEIGMPVSLVKEPENHYDREAIAVMLPVVGKCGYVANSPYTVVRGCLSSGRLYDHFEQECLGIVRFITDNQIILRVFPEKLLQVDLHMQIKDQTDVTSYADFQQFMREAFGEESS